MNILYLITAIALWGIVHSLLASNIVKDSTRHILGDGFMRLYRLGFNIFAVLSFLPIIYLMFTLPDRLLYSVPPPWRYLMMIGQGISALLLVVALLQTDTLSRFY